MGQSVSGLRDKFYRRLILEYRKDGTGSFLYRYFWTECATELLARHLPAYAGPVEPEDEPQIMAQLKDALKQQSRPEQNKRSRKKKREVSDFWEELWLRDARVQAGLSSKADYFLWLAQVVILNAKEHEAPRTGRFGSIAFIFLYHNRAGKSSGRAKR